MVICVGVGEKIVGEKISHADHSGALSHISTVADRNLLIPLHIKTAMTTYNPEQTSKLESNPYSVKLPLSQLIQTS